jgi:hypothetical protein
MEVITASCTLCRHSAEVTEGDPEKKVNIVVFVAEIPTGRPQNMERVLAVVICML